MASGREEVPASLNSAALLCSGWGLWLWSCWVWFLCEAVRKTSHVTILRISKVFPTSFYFFFFFPSLRGSTAMVHVPLARYIFSLVLVCFLHINSTSALSSASRWNHTMGACECSQQVPASLFWGYKTWQALRGLWNPQWGEQVGLSGSHYERLHCVKVPRLLAELTAAGFIWPPSLLWLKSTLSWLWVSLVPPPFKSRICQ